MDTTSFPVEMVSWDDAAEFCITLSQKEQYQPFYQREGETMKPLAGTGYRLLSEAEWEYACRAGTTSQYWSGDTVQDLRRVGRFKENSDNRTYAVGELPANPFGLFDVHGNVWEWVEDGWDAAFDAESIEKPAIDPHRPFLETSQRVLRGGTWYFPASLSRSSARFAFAPTARHFNIGFRLSLPVDAVRQMLKVTGPAIPNSAKAAVTDASTPSTAKPLAPLPQVDLDETDPLPK